MLSSSTAKQKVQTARKVQTISLVVAVLLALAGYYVFTYLSKYGTSNGMNERFGSEVWMVISGVSSWLPAFIFLCVWYIQKQKFPRIVRQCIASSLYEKIQSSGATNLKMEMEDRVKFQQTKEDTNNYFCPWLKISGRTKNGMETEITSVLHRRFKRVRRYSSAKTASNFQMDIGDSMEIIFQVRAEKSLSNDKLSDLTGHPFAIKLEENGIYLSFIYSIEIPAKEKLDSEDFTIDSEKFMDAALAHFHSNRVTD